MDKSRTSLRGTDEEKHLSFIALLLNRAEVPFSKKIELLGVILEQHYPDLLQQLPGLINKLDSVRRLRNKFAHSELVLNDKGLEAAGKGILLRRVNRDGKVVEEFIKAEDADKRILTANYLGFFIFFLYLEIQNRATGKDHNQYKEVFEALKKKYPDTFKEEAEPAKG